MAWHSRLLYHIVVYSMRLYFHHQTSTTGHCLRFGSASSFLLDLFLHSSPVVYWTPTNPGGSSFSVICFCLFILFMGFSRQECWSGLPSPSPVNHVLSYLSAITQPSWVVLYGMVQSFIELSKAIILVHFLWLWFPLCLLSEGWESTNTLPDGRDWLWGKLGLALVGRAMPSTSLIQFSAAGWGCALSLKFGLR